MTDLLWLRREVRATERRTPLTPADAASLVASGVEVMVERSPQRVFDDDAYAASGCTLVEAGSWVEAPGDAVVLGIKELPEEPRVLRHRHVYFGHAYKGQDGAEQLLERFLRGRGALLDLEYLVDSEGRRLVAFSHWAGYVGAALGVLRLADALPQPLQPLQRSSLDAALRAAGASIPGARAVVTGAAGRAGRGALEALAVAGVAATGWDQQDTAVLDRDALFGHDLLVQCVLATVRQPAFVSDGDRARADRRLRVLADVTCDVTSGLNLLQVSDRLTTWDDPVRTIWADQPPLEAIVIDNLPSLLPVEASTSFSAALAPLLPGLFTDSPPWRRARASFVDAVRGT